MCFEDSHARAFLRLIFAFTALRVVQSDVPLCLDQILSLIFDNM